MLSARKLRTMLRQWHFISCSTIFARVHQSLRITPAMAAGISDHLWEIEEIVGLLEQQEKVQTKTA
jgi:hypothetical protein